MSQLNDLCKNTIYMILGERTYLQFSYLYYHRGFLHLHNPKRYSEKLYWLKQYYGNEMKELIQLCYDKYTVREYVKRKIGDKYLTQIYGVYHKADQIEFEKLPKEFVLKITQSSGCNIVVNSNNKKTFNEIRNTLGEWLKYTNSEKRITNAREEAYYFDGNAKIICEEYLKTQDDNIPEDIRFFCFNGEPKFFCVDFQSTDCEGNKLHDYYRNTYSVETKEFIPVNFGRKYNDDFKAPDLKNWDEMVTIAKKLSEDFPFVRVDLYNINGRIVFGELTWIPQGGMGRITPKKFDYKFGSMLCLPNISGYYGKK